MKRILFVVLLVLLLVLAGCSSSNSGLAKNERVLTQEEFKNCFTYVTITSDNWEDYFEISEYTDPVDNSRALICNFKKEHLTDLCGYPEIELNFSYDSKYLSKDINSETKEVINEYKDDAARSEDDTIYIYPKNEASYDRYYYLNYITQTHYENDNGFNSYYNCNVTSVTDYEITNLNVVSANGTLCYANYSDEMFNTNSLNERYVCFDLEDGTRMSLFENGLIRWDRGSGYGYYNNESLYDNSYYDYFENEQR